MVSSPALTAPSPGYQWASPVELPLLQALLLLEGRKKQKWAPTGNTWAKWLKVRRLSWLVWQNNFTKIIYKSKVRQSCRVAIFLSGIFRDRKPRHHLYKSNGEYHYHHRDRECRGSWKPHLEISWFLDHSAYLAVAQSLRKVNVVVLLSCCSCFKKSLLSTEAEHSIRAS